jgi:NAD(P)-dependent dehydrogenase (short-subunit alcohol dehydrogenase family)
MMMMQFTGLTVLLTGATGGFGRAAAQRFHSEGANLVLSDVGAEALDALASQFDSARVTTLSGSIGDERLSQDLVALALDTFGSLDVAVNNAGIAHPLQRLPDIDSDVARRVIDIDLMGVFYAMKHQLPVMEKQYRERGRKGAVVNVASVAGVSGAPTASIYAAAKHGVVGLTKSAALEYVRRGIRVNALCPSFARTPMVMQMVESQVASGQATAQEAEAHVVRGIPARRLAEVSEVIEALVFAASPANSFYTGQTIHVDGGMTAA